jgi:GTPase SAR1 family protein
VESLKHNKTLQTLLSLSLMSLFFSHLSSCRGVDLCDYLTTLSLPLEFVDKSNDEILSFLRELQQTTPNHATYRMRVMLVGPGDAGKTTLVQKILTGEFLHQQFTMTDGISTNDWLVSAPNSNDVIQFSFWDFGGQEVYLNSHHLLFSNQTLYLLVWNPRAGTTLRQLEEYILNIRNKARDAPIVLITTRSAEVHQREYQDHLNGLQKYNYVIHQAIDSCSGDGIEKLQQILFQLVTTQLASYSRVLVPGWYASVEKRLQEEALHKFYLQRIEFQSLCQSIWLQNDCHEEEKEGEEEELLLKRIDTLLELFHNWGVIYVLPNGMQSNDEIDSSVVTTLSASFRHSGDIILNPKQLADVFKCVITCSRDTVNTNRQLFEYGIFHHRQVELVWSKYDSRLCCQFLSLLHTTELAYELCDCIGRSTGQSLVPCLLPKSTVGITETDLRAKLFDGSVTPSSRHLIAINQMISRGYIKITFNSLLSNFFPKLLVRLRYLSSVSDSTRNCFVIRVPLRNSQGSRSGLVIGWSAACVIEELSSDSLLVYPGGCSFDATAICHQAIRALLDESFSMIEIKEVLLSAEGSMISHESLQRLLSQNLAAGAVATIPLYPGELQISLGFMACLFPSLDTQQEAHLDLSSLELPNVEIQTLSLLQDRLLRAQQTRDLCDLMALGRSLLQSIPIFRRRGFGLDSHPNILWVVAQCSATASASSSAALPLFMYGVTPSVNPCLPWEIIPETEIPFTMSAHLTTHTRPTTTTANPPIHPLSSLLLQSLRLLLPNQQFPEWTPGTSADSNEPMTWMGVMPLSMSMPMDFRSKQKQIQQMEVKHFLQERDLFGDFVFYSKDIFSRQRGTLSREEIQSILRPLFSEMRTEFNEMRNGFQLLSQQNMSGLTQLQEVWSSQLNHLKELVLQSNDSDKRMRMSSDTVVVFNEMITEEIKTIHKALMAKMTDLQLTISSSGSSSDPNQSNLQKLLDELGKKLIVANNLRADEQRDDSERMVNELFEQLQTLWNSS